LLQDIKKEKIALIYANGAIDSKMAGKIINDLKKVKEDDAIKCVILRVNSPGGSAMASEAIHAHCKDLSKVSYNSLQMVRCYSSMQASFMNFTI